VLAWIFNRICGNFYDMINSSGIFEKDPFTEKEKLTISIDLVSGLDALQ
jgi:serine/threonine protein kinase